MISRSFPNWVRIKGPERVISLRLIATLAVAGLVAGTMLAIARVNEQYTRQALLAEAESRMLLEAGNLALLSQNAMLTEFPELTLVPLITDLQDTHPEIALVVVVDHRNFIRGSADPRSIGKLYKPMEDLEPCSQTYSSNNWDRVWENDELRLAEALIQRTGERTLGRVILGVEKGHVEMKVRQARKDLITYAAILLPVAMGLAALLMTLLLRPIPTLREGLERIGRGDLDSPMKLRDPTELGALARSINDMAARLKASQSEVHAREEEVIATQEEIVATQKEIIHTLGDVVENRSAETAHHTQRVAAISMKLAELAGLSSEEANILRMASPMHDVGKIGIPDRILNKRTKLTPDEFEVMETHAEIGYKILAKSKRVILQAAAIIAHEHHERWDGSGYPQGLVGEEIHIYGRIVSLADVFDALFSDRVYRPAMELDQVLKIIREGHGTHFQPELVDLFMSNLDAFLVIHRQIGDQDIPLKVPEPRETASPIPELVPS